MGDTWRISKRKMVHIETTEVCYVALRMLISISEELSDFIEATNQHVHGHSYVPLPSETKVMEEIPSHFNAGDYILASPGTTKSSKATSQSTEAPKKASSPSPLARRGRSTQALQSTLPLKMTGKPFSNYANLVLCGMTPGHGRTGVTAMILLDNPAGEVTLSMADFVHNVQCIFGLRGSNIRMFHDSAFTKELVADSNVLCLAQRTIFVCPRVLAGVAQCSLKTLRGPLCRYVNILGRSVRGTLLLENPCGYFLTWSEALAQASVILGKSAKDIRLSRTGDSSGIQQPDDDTHLARLHSTTIFVL